MIIQTRMRLLPAGLRNGMELRIGLTRWIGYYNVDRPHSALAGRTPDEAYGVQKAALRVGLAPAPASFQLAA